MKNTIIFYYGLNPEDLIEEKDLATFYINYDKYQLRFVDRPLKDFEDIVKIISPLSPKFHQIIPNKENSLFTKVDDRYYILLKIKNPEHGEIDLLDIISFNSKIGPDNSSLKRTNWNELWSQKVDYLEYQVSELASNKSIIRNSFSYYIGLAENAIEYFNLLDTKDLELHISHKRIKYPTTTGYFYDPLNIILDFKVRDIASYLKMKFFHVDRKTIQKDLDILVNKDFLKPLEYNLLFARLMYPSYYFDALTSILEDNKDEEILLKYIEQVNDFEKFLNLVYAKFSQKASMIKIDWLIKS